MNNGADFMCPLTGLPMNGRYRFFAFRRSGLVVSEKALKEVRLGLLQHNALCPAD